MGNRYLQQQYVDAPAPVAPTAPVAPVAPTYLQNQYVKGIPVFGIGLKPAVSVAPVAPVAPTYL